MLQVQVRRSIKAVTDTLAGSAVESGALHLHALTRRVARVVPTHLRAQARILT